MWAIEIPFGHSASQAPVLAEYTNDSVRRAISYVPQNVELFSKTIYDNIRVSRMEIGRAHV